MKAFTLFCLTTLALHASAGEIRPALVDSSRAFLDEKTTAEDLLRVARAQRDQHAFNDEEKAYLEDLTTRIPPSFRKELCPTTRDGLCEGKTVANNDWTSVPVVPTETTSPPAQGSWLSRNWGWLAAGAVLGFAASSSLKGKRIQFHGQR